MCDGYRHIKGVRESNVTQNGVKNDDSGSGIEEAQGFVGWLGEVSPQPSQGYCDEKD